MKKLKLLFAALALLVGEVCSINAQTDYTSSLPTIGNNWDFTSNGPWQGENVALEGPKGQCVDMQTYKFAEVYNNQTSGTAFEVYKSLSVPNGTYIFQMAAFGRRANIWGDDEPNTAKDINAEIFANDVTKPVTSNTFVFYTVTTTVTNGSLKVGLRAKNGNKPNWWGYTDFTLLRVDGGQNVDLTKLLVNHSFEGNSTTGWTLGKTSSDTQVCTPDGNHATTGADGSYIFNTWWQGVPISQIIEDMPNGQYTLTAALASSDPGADAKLYMLSQDGHSDVITITQGTSGTFSDYSYIFNVNNNSVKVGVVGGNADGTFNEEGHWWYKADNFRLSYKSFISADAFELLDGGTIEANKYYALAIPFAGNYNISSTNAATVTYTQNGAQIVNSETSTSTIAIAANSTETLNDLSVGTLYVKANTVSDITIRFATNEADMTSLISNAAVTSKDGWNDGRINSGQQYTGAPDNTYMDTWNAQLSQNQDVTLPSGYYLLKCATRADETITTNPNIYVYSYATQSNLNSTIIHHEGNSGNLLGNGWGWTYVPFTVSATSKVGIGFWSDCTGSKWAGADDFHLTYYTSELEMKKAHLAQVVADANAWAEKLTTTPALETALSAEAPTCTTADEYDTAISNLTNTIANGRATSLIYSEFIRLKEGAEAMTQVANNNATATSTLTTATSDQNTAAEAATTPDALNTAISTLRTAIKTFIAAAEPTGGASFEITCLVENPSFDNNTIDGWTRTYSDGGAAATNYTCNEFWNNTFNIYQDLEGLPNGSYQLSVQAFSRPGGNEVAYPAYVGGTNSVTAELYVNNDASTVGNIYAYTGNTTDAKVTSGSFVDYKCVVEGGTDYWVPNGMEGANLYFANEDVYKTTVAALVEDGKLRIGFRDKTLTASQWTIFDNFRLYYYGSDKSVYYAQYLPQLIAEVEADLSNALYKNVAGKDLDDLNKALNVDASGFNTEQQYSDAIKAIKDAQTAFRASYPAYDRLAAAIEKANNLIENNKYSSNSEFYLAAVEAKTGTTATAPTALVAANALFYNMLTYNMVELQVGFEGGEYAPYNIVPVIPFLNNSNQIDESKVNAGTIDALNSAIDKVADMGAPNLEEVNAFYDGDFSKCEEDDESPLDYTPTGWTASENMRMMLKNAETYPGLSDAAATSAIMSWKDGITYGETVGYTMPLKENTVYRLSLKAAGWNDETRSGIKVSVLNGTEGLDLTNLGTPDHDIKAAQLQNTAGMTSYVKYFKTGAAGNYVFHVESGNNMVLTDFELKKAVAEDIIIDQDVTYTPVEQFANVKLARPLSANWNTFVVPFDIDNTTLKSTFGDNVEVAEYTETASGDNSTVNLTKMTTPAVTANVPVLLKPTSAMTDSKIWFYGVLIKEGEPKVPGTNFDFVGTYAAETYIAVGDYFINSNKLYRAKEENKTKIKGTRAYIKAKEEATEARVMNFFIDGEETTNIEGLVIEGAGTGKIYNLNGQEVKTPKKGLYIQNGKKISIK